ncbi:MAG: hypothetical protein Q7T82_10695 [Armatimonadota bacterium]|nr:hypothetical protein [Armatimonadota bacterium]
MDESFPKDLRDYLRARPSLSKRQKAALSELVRDCQEQVGLRPDELAARYVRRCLKSGWRSVNPG